jgi:hypothetical protein
VGVDWSSRMTGRTSTAPKRTDGTRPTIAMASSLSKTAGVDRQS